MSRRTVIIVSASVVAIVVAAWLGLRRPANNANFPEGTYWMCSNQGCGHEFNLTMKQLGEHHRTNYGQPVSCPNCKQPAVRAQRCPHCGKIYPMQRQATPCPSCKQMPTAAPAAT